jgi:hypothetical protein
MTGGLAAGHRPVRGNGAQLGRQDGAGSDHDLSKRSPGLGRVTDAGGLVWDIVAVE